MYRNTHLVYIACTHSGFSVWCLNLIGCPQGSLPGRHWLYHLLDGRPRTLLEHYLYHVSVLLFELLIQPAVAQDGHQGKGAFKFTLPVLHGPPGQLGQQFFSKPGRLGVDNAI